jgi:uncharacterized protein (TIGR02646 family)
MLEFTRLDAPKCLTDKDNYKVWGKDYAKSKKWFWHEYQGNQVDKILRKPLLEQTKNHCSFCDAYRIPRPIAPTVEHFRPKNIFPLLAYTWHNLFICCHNCQKIIAGFDSSRGNLRKLLKPDSKDYSFQKYFYFDSKTGKIEIKKGKLSSKEIEKAELTRVYYQLNDEELIKSRLDILDDYEHYLKKDCSKRPYRFMFKDCKENIN